MSHRNSSVLRRLSLRTMIRRELTSEETPILLMFIFILPCHLLRISRIKRWLTEIFPVEHFPDFYQPCGCLKGDKYSLCVAMLLLNVFERGHVTDKKETEAGGQGRETTDCLLPVYCVVLATLKLSTRNASWTVQLAVTVWGSQCKADVISFTVYISPSLPFLTQTPRDVFLMLVERTIDCLTWGADCWWGEGKLPPTPRLLLTQTLAAYKATTGRILEVWPV